MGGLQGLAIFGKDGEALGFFMKFGGQISRCCNFLVFTKTKNI